MKTRALISTLALLFASACSAQKGTDYQGEPAAQVRGTIVATSSSQTAVDAMLLWNNFAKNGDTIGVSGVTARGEFPARFTIDVLDPPSAEQRNDFSRKGTLPNETPVGVAYIFAVPHGSAFDKQNILGVVEDFVVVFVEHDVVPGTISATFLGGALPAGFHLMKVERPEPGASSERQTACYASLPPDLGPQEEYARCHASDIFDKLHPTEGDFETEVTLKLAPKDQLDIPNYN